MTELNPYLEQAGIDPAETALCFHRPVERAFAHFLPQLLVDEAALFEAYQSTYSDRATAILGQRKYLASFVGHPDGWSVFAGLFQIGEIWQRPVADIVNIPEIQRLYEEFGVGSEFFEGMTQSCPWVNLTRCDEMAGFLGRLEVVPPSGGSYVRKADEVSIAVATITEDPVLNLPMPDWRDVILLAREVRVLPKAWAAELETWRGVYLITDERDGKQFVGGSFGAENMLSSWRAHVSKTGAGSDALSARDPMRFRFSVLERIDDTSTMTEGDALVQSWIARLNTRKFGLNAA